MSTVNYQMLKEKMESRYDPDNLFLKKCNYDVWFQNEKLTDTTRKSDKKD